MIINIVINYKCNYKNCFNILIDNNTDYTELIWKRYANYDELLLANETQKISPWYRSI